MATIQELIGDVKSGEILLPEFQRGYVWNSDQVRGLVQSLYRKHPTGHFLTWKTTKPTKVRGSSANGDGHSLLLLDGQQRLTSLFVLFEGVAPPFYEGESLFFNLYFNMQTSEFRFWSKSLMEGSPDWIGVHTFLKQGLNSLLESLPNQSDELQSLVQNNLARLAQLDAIRNYSFQIDQLSGDDLTTTEVVSIFNRVNSAGTPLTKADLAIAHVCSLWPEAREGLRKFSRDMDIVGFGIDLDFLIRCTAAVATGSVLLEGSFFKVPIEDLQAAWKKVQSAFEHLVNVLRHEGYVDSLSDLPTRNVLIPLTVYLAAHGSSFTDDAIKNRFLRWMFLAGIWGRYSSSAETNLQKDISLIADDDPTEGLVNHIYATRGRINVEAADLVGKARLSPLYKLSYVVARSRGSKDWFTGEILYKKAVGKSGGLESHHIYPKAVLKKAGLSPSDDRMAINQIGNRAFLTQKANRKIGAQLPSEYLQTIAASHPGALEAQCVPMDRSLWEVGRFDDFINERCRLIAKAMNNFLDDLVGPDLMPQPAPRNLQSIIEQGESSQVEFKSTLRWDLHLETKNTQLEHAVIKTVAGFANTSGGTLLLGVSDAGEILGLSNDFATLSKPNRDGFELHLHQILAGALGEAALPYVSVTFHGFEGRDVCQLSVGASEHPIYVVRAGESALVIRAGNATKVLPVNEAVIYVGSHWK